jgi:phosphoglycolate phosphatase-like HAD superfamily hydrolase
MSLQLDLTKYKTIVFDADGVILDSNITKIDSYFRTAKKLGGTNEQAQLLVDYHVKHAGIPSYPKFKWFIESVLKEEATPERINEFQDAFGLAVKRGSLGCRLAEGLNELRQRTSHANWMVVTETDESQIRALFEERGISQLFNGGIFGSPHDKDEILTRENAVGHIISPALFIGDCKYDYEASTRAGLDFVFISDWTDVSDWESFCANNNIQTFKNIKSL